MNVAVPSMNERLPVVALVSERKATATARQLLIRRGWEHHTLALVLTVL